MVTSQILFLTVDGGTRRVVLMSPLANVALICFAYPMHLFHASIHLIFDHYGDRKMKKGLEFFFFYSDKKNDKHLP